MDLFFPIYNEENEGVVSSEMMVFNLRENNGDAVDLGVALTV